MLRCYSPPLTSLVCRELRLVPVASGTGMAQINVLLRVLSVEVRLHHLH